MTPFSVPAVPPGRVFGLKPGPHWSKECLIDQSADLDRPVLVVSHPQLGCKRGRGMVRLRVVVPFGHRKLDDMAVPSANPDLLFAFKQPSNPQSITES